MRRHVVVSLLVILACARGTRDIPRVVPDPVALLPPVHVPAPRNVHVDSILGTLTPRQKIGQLLMPWLLGDYSAVDGASLASTRFWTDSLEVGGIIISIGSPLDVAAKLNTLQRRSSLPLLVAADLEYGAGMRFTGATAFPAPMAFGATGSAVDAYALGRVSALEARAIGVHMTFSPVADLNNNPANPIINTRSWGEDPAAVGPLLAAYVRGATEHGLYTTAKHFPGHGDVGLDSHIAVPVVAGCWPRLDSLELEPFRAAIAAGVTAVMTAHVALPCLDGPDPVPATLSARVMTDILRDSLGFEGLVVTDALIMGAIVERYGPGESAVLAFEAGSDLLLYPADPRAALDAMERAVRSGRITPERLDRSVRRVLQLKADAGLFADRTVDLATLPAVVGTASHQAISDDIAQRALTLVQEGPLAGFRAERGRTALVAYAEETNLTMSHALVRALRAQGEAVTVFRLYPASGPASYDSARVMLSQAPRAVFAASVRPIAWRGHVALPEPLAVLIAESDDQRPTVLTSFGSPYLLSQLPAFGGTYLLAWSAVPATERATARALTGAAPITGRLPITLSDAYPAGFGIDVP